MPKKRQKTYSLPLPIVEWLTTFFRENHEELARMGITNETQLLTALVKNGQPFIEEIVAHIKDKSKK